MYAENELLPLSGVQHLIFCERQAALIHVEGLWADNALTVEGGHRHKRVHEGSPRRERRGEVIISRGLVLRSLRLGLAGIADVVEFHRIVSKASDPEGKPVETPRNGIRISGAEGLWVPFPVEY
ncbi:MAG: Dna2/Cas4 domain-containing protein, partial [Thermodesulfobacteriota bacterium]|nr:Dna2/Cas4 domain-containing protein [Thermodesulfobacteriota bacterium]